MKGKLILDKDCSQSQYDNSFALKVNDARISCGVNQCPNETSPVIHSQCYFFFQHFYKFDLKILSNFYLGQGKKTLDNL